MKKLAFIFLMCAMSFGLTSCQINWFGEQYDAPWMIIAVPIVVICAIDLFVMGRYVASKKYVCSECGKSFYPKWWQAAFSVHVMHYRYFKCPHCGKKDFCVPSRETED